MENTTESNTNTPTPPPIKTWQELGLSPAALELIAKTGFATPTPVQSQAIPLALDGRDVIASAQTGTGKTAAFVLPMVEKFVGREGTFGIILCPTREIAQQTQATLELFGTPRGVRSIVMIGGVDMRYDMQALNTYPQIIVATPGRLCDHLDRGNLWLDFIEVVVLDEADRMLDMGFSDQLNRIMTDIPSHRQTLLFSATFNPPVEKLARKILHEPERVTIGRTSSAAVTVEQRVMFMDEESKKRRLMDLFKEEPGSIIVFTRSKDSATKLWRSLHSSAVYDATFIHSDRLQRDREQALADFKEGKYRILIATDVAARGLHVEGVAHVVNYEMPLEPEDYVHRIGRTGRAGQTGRATSFCSPRERRLLVAIERMLKKEIPTSFAGSASSAGAAPEGRPAEKDGSAPSGEHRERREPREHRGHREPRGEKREGEKREHAHKPQGQGHHAKPHSGEKQHAKPHSGEAHASHGAHGSQPKGEGQGGENKKRRRRRRGGRGGGPKSGGPAPTGSGGSGSAFPV